MKKLDLVILAGGKGSRIKKYLNNKPKPMIEFNKISFLQYLINIYSKYPFRKIFILVGFKSKTIIKKYHKKVFNFTEITCLKERKPMGTGGALINLKRENIKDFVLINGDSIFNIDLVNFLKLMRDNKLASIALTSSKKNIFSKKLNNLGLKRNTLIYKKRGNYINGGVYFFKKRILKYIPNKSCSLENDVLPKIIYNKKTLGKFYKSFFLDIGTPKYLKIAEKKLSNFFRKPAVFLDRDGVINYDRGYVHNKKNFKFKKGVLEGLKYIIKKNYYLFIVTNQAGIGKGFFKEEDFKKLHLYLKEKLAKKNIFFDDIMYSPFHPKARILKFKKKSNLRKPGNLMITKLFQKWLIKKNKSFMIGDKKSDYLAAKKSGLKFHYAEHNFYNQVRKIINNY